MKNRRDLVKGWLDKAHSDECALKALAAANTPDLVAFHAQQFAEKTLKAFLICQGISFPFTHNLVKLVEICAEVERGFLGLLPAAERLTPYAVEVRYDPLFWPDEECTQDAVLDAHAIHDFVMARLPAEFK